MALPHDAATCEHIEEQDWGDDWNFVWLGDEKGIVFCPECWERLKVRILDTYFIRGLSPELKEILREVLIHLP